MAEADDIVVGSGLVGAAAARRLAEAGRRVRLVQEGRVVTEPPGSHVRNRPEYRDRPDDYFEAIDDFFDYVDPDADPAGLPGAYTTSVVGGSSIVWTNNCPRAVPGVDRPGVLRDRSGEEYYALAERYLDVRSHEFDDSHRARTVADRLDGPLRRQGRAVSALPLAGRRGPEGDAISFVGPADVLAGSSGPVEVVTGRAESIPLEDGRVRSVRIDGVDHPTRTAVVAAGAVDTPRLLWRSGLTSPALGRHLSYHPVLMAQIVLDASACREPGTFDARPRLCIPPTPQRPWLAMLLRDTNPWPVATDDRDVDENRLMEIQVFAPVTPHGDNHLEAGPKGPRFEVPLRAEDEDRRRAIEADVDVLCGHLGRYRRGSEPQWAPLGTPHLTGSARMGPADDGESVVDTDGRVWGTDGLYVAGNAVIATRMAVNPTLTAVALALRTADGIIGS